MAQDFEPAETAVWQWVRQAKIDAGQRDGRASSERQGLEALRRDNRRLREDVDVLKGAHRVVDAMQPMWANFSGLASLRSVVIRPSVISTVSSQTSSPPR
ncbi:hypothetical protein AB0J71_46380 [Nonomuraea sp. NPDC049637]|uniref:hypothetical protein n=1 Tax=Nonomuraea sp. NPDC049637 TaxID=3154356 RepID=UPI003435AF38